MRQVKHELMEVKLSVWNHLFDYINVKIRAKNYFNVGGKPGFGGHLSDEGVFSVVRASNRFNIVFWNITHPIWRHIDGPSLPSS